MEKSNTKIEKQLKKKTNPELVETIVLCRKNSAWKEVASILSGLKANRINKNLEEINKNSKEGETVVISGKVLSGGNLKKKVKVVSFAFSEKAIEKLKKSKIDYAYIVDEVKKNKDAKGVKILK